MENGVRFGSYELRALLGTGGMARVYRAVRTGPMGFEKEVAVKILDPKATATEDQITSLTDEARLGGLLRHQNIVATDELGQVGPNYYIAMELVDGWPLEQLLKEHATRRVPVPRQVIIDVMAAICDGLAYAHALTDRSGESLRLVHRDMKPGNVMISRSGEVKIMDFGIAEATTNKYATAEQSTRGTPLFMSPEQVMGGDLDGRSDIFALGSILNELVTLRPTFGGDEVIAILRAVLDVDITAAKERIGKHFPEVLPIFLRCMEKDPDDRYPDAASLARELRAVGERLPKGVSIRRWVDQFAPLLPAARTGELGNILPQGLENAAPPRDPNIDRDAHTVELEVLDDAPKGDSSFEMPLGPSAGPARGRPTPSTVAAVPGRKSTAPNLAPPPSVWSSRQLPPAPEREPSPRPAAPPSSAWSPRVQGPMKGAYGRNEPARAPSAPSAPGPQRLDKPRQGAPHKWDQSKNAAHPWDPPKQPKPKKKAPPRPATSAPVRKGPPRVSQKEKRKTWQKRAAYRAAVTRLAMWVGGAVGLLWGLRFLDGPIGETAKAIWRGIFGG